MAERLTDSEVSKSFTEQELKTSEQARIYQKLGKLEDILEKYGIEGVEELEKELSISRLLHQTIAELSKMVTKAENERDIWRKACELACEKLNDCFNDEQIESGFCYRVDNSYQQAKKDGEQK